MEEERKRELAVKLIVSFAREKGVTLYPLETANRKLKQLSEEIGADVLILKNFVMDVLRYMLMCTFADRHQEDEINEQFKQILCSAQWEDVAIKLFKHLIYTQGLHLKANNRRVGEIAQKADIPKDELIEFIRPIIHELVDEIIG